MTITQGEEYTAAGMVGGYRPDLIRMKECGNGKCFPVYQDSIGSCSEKGAIGNIREMNIGGRVFRVYSMFDADATKTPTDAMLRVIDSDLEKDMLLQ